MSDENIAIRDMTDEDVDAILAIDRKMVGAERVQTYRNPKSAHLGGETDLSKVAEADGQIVGFAIGRVITHAYRMEDIGFLSLIGVLPEYRRKGLASKLIQAFLSSCKKRKIGHVTTLINLKDEEMSSLFKTVGFLQNNVAEYIVSTRDS